ncbi:EVE domain-containing protein [Gallaecimonas mangrovi]|uniref:EVE domain-containing protein n=1 Tax=Gallaecimonas mangrovi TaxID=2291597 RepID=UPI000E2068C7|nr:EVE domain-containing protein [Gallaecimonas mangrovi]
MPYWLLKTEPDLFSIRDLAEKNTTPWDGVRNYQARNFMDQMRLGDRVFLYHSSCKEVGIAGIGEVVRESYPDVSQFDDKSPYFDPKSDPAKPRWRCVDIGFVESWPKVLPLARLKSEAALADMPLVQKGSRLSVMPVTDQQWQHILGIKP